MKNLMTLTLMSLVLSTTMTNAVAAPSKSNYSDQYVPLCVDLARRVVSDKVAFYQKYKHVKKSKRSTASVLSFDRFPTVVNQNVDKKMLSLILSSVKAKKNAKNFTQKLDAEEKLITGMSNLMKREARPYLQSCFNTYQLAEKRCSAYVSANFNKYTQCVSSITGEKSPSLAKFIPYLSYKQKLRSVASAR